MHRQTIALQCYLTIPQGVTILHENRIDLNDNKDVFKDLIEVPPSDDWFPYEYIDAEVNKKLDKRKYDLQAMKQKRRLNITCNISITIPSG